MAEVSVEDLSVSFGATRALGGVTLDFHDGGFFALLGPSGSGKTTLLRAIAGFVRADAGAIRIGGRSVEHVPVEDRDIGFMFQSYALFPNMTVAENVGFGLRVRRVGAAEERRRVAEALDLVRMGDLGGRRPRDLSGGQRQRVALARAFVTAPRVLLLDEPLSALDKALRVEMQSELRRIQREIGITSVFVTHDQDEALTLADRIGILREGRLIQAGTPREVYDHPHDVFAATFLGDANLLLGTILGDVLRLTDGSLVPLGASDAPAARHAVRPEALDVTIGEPPIDGRVRLRGRLIDRTFSGATARARIEAGGQELRAVARDRDLPGVGPVWVSWHRSATMRIPAS